MACLLAFSFLTVEEQDRLDELASGGESVVLSSEKTAFEYPSDGGGGSQQELRWCVHGARASHTTREQCLKPRKKNN